MRKRKDYFRKNWGLIPLSIFLAFLLWFLVVQIENPTISKTFNNVQVTFINESVLDEQGKVYRVLENSDVVRVTVAAPKSVIDSLQASDIVAEADLSKLTDINTVAITCYIPTVDSVDSYTPSRDSVKLSVEEKASKYVTLVANTIGQVEEGYLLHTVTLDQNMIEISGPQSSVDQVSYAGVEVDVSGISNSLAANMEIILYDEQGRAIEPVSLKKQTNYAHVSAEVLSTKRVSVYASHVGDPASGYAYAGDLSVSPASVLIAGTTSNLAGITRITVMDPVNIEGASEDVTTVVNVTDYLPDGVILADVDFNGEVTITIPVQATKTRTLLVPLENIRLVNVPDGYTMSIDAVTVHDGYRIQVSGLSEDLDQLEADGVTGYLDIGAWIKDENIKNLNQSAYVVPFVLDGYQTVKATQEITVRIKVEKVGN